MVGEAETSNLLTPLQPQNSSLQTRRGSGGVTVDYFPVGSAVEVRTDEEGFKYVYFTATVISHTPASKSPKKSNRGRKPTKKSGKDKSTFLDVEYHNLLAHDDGSDRLRETVHISFVRPVQPLQEIVKGFELGDSVDAFYKDGWWEGVVTQVKEDAVRYIVTFQDPPDWIEFGPEDLRFHCEWVNESWVRPQKENMTGLMFEVGRKVEVSFDREDSQDAWFPASIDEDLGNGIFRVEYTDKKGEAVKTTVDSHHVRPCPPLLKDKNFVLLEKVDAYFDYCWWSGVITKELESCRYVVFFKPMKRDREINQSNLRPHMEWKEGKWFTSSQSPDDGVHEHHISENSGAMAAAAPVRNSVDGKTPTSLTSTKGHVEQLTPDNQKMSHMTTSLKKRRHLTDSGTSHSQPPKKQKEGHAVATKPQDRYVGDGYKEVLCGFVSPDSASNADTSPVETTEDQTSFDHSWDKQIQRKQRNIRTKQNSSGIITPTPSSMKNSAPTLFESRNLDIRGEVLGAAENYLEEAQNENANEGLVVPIIIGLPCFETGSPGLSGGKKSQTFKIKEVASLVSDQERPLLSSSISNAKDKTQTGPRESSEKRKRGRPRRAVVESTQTPVSGNAQNGNAGSGDLQGSPEVVVFDAEAMMSDPKRSEGNKDKVAEGLPYLKNKRVRTMKRTSPSLNKENGTKESVELGENKKKGNKKSAVQVEDSLDASGGTVVEVDRTIEEPRIVEQPSAEFDNEPLSKWIVELNSPPMIDSSGRSPEGTLVQCRVNGERQRDAVVIDEAGETQLGSGIHPSVSVDKNPTVSSEPHRLRVVQKNVGIMLDLNIENQPETEPQAPVLAEKGFTKPRDIAQSMPFVKTISLWKTIESMEVFQKMPQKPHFQPLELVEESSYRESLAIGLMVTFASMVDATSKLQLSDPKSIVDEMIETVEKLDNHGFDVGILRDHIAKFVEVKEKEESLVGALTDLNDQIGHCYHESTRIEEEMREINEQIRKLQEKHSAAESAKGKMAEKVTSLKAQLEKTEDNIVNLRHTFKGGVSDNAP